MDIHPIYNEYPFDDVLRILRQDKCELDGEFPGFVEKYEALSKIIPTYFTVVDFGCNLAAQCCLFKNNKEYIGVDVIDLERFKVANTQHYVCSISEFVRKHKDKLPPDTFAICSYVPDEVAVEIVRRTFKNVFCFYPQHTSPLYL